MPAARNRRASASAPTRPHRHPGPAPVTAIFNFGQDNRTEETQKTEEATAPDGEQSNNVTNGGGPGGFFENAGAMFRSKSGGVGDVLEQNTGEGSDKNYGGDAPASATTIPSTASSSTGTPPWKRRRSSPRTSRLAPRPRPRRMPWTICTTRSPLKTA